MKYMLAVTGGGIRGVIPACALVELEKQMGKLTRDIFSFVGGTSTGALISAAVAVGIPAADILRIYTDHSGDIFNHSKTFSLLLQIERGWAFDPMNIKRVLVKEFGAAASWTMDQCPLKVLTCSLAPNGKEWFMVPTNPKNSGATGSIPLVDGAVASAAAPPYFKPFPVTIGGQVHQLADGGITGVANPTYEMAVEAFEFDSYLPDETRCVTIGTGFFSPPETPPDGLLAEINWIVDCLIDSSEDWVDRAVARQWPGLAQKLNVELPSNIGMADVSSIPVLVELGQRWAVTLDWKKLLS